MNDFRQSLQGLSLWDLAVIEWRIRWLREARPKQIIDFSKINQDTVFFHCGRGFGKSLTLGQWIAYELCTHPNTFGHLVAPTHNDIRYVNIEGPSGILRVVPKVLVKTYNKTDAIIEFFNGSVLRGFSSEEPERLRGPQCFPGETLVRMADGNQRPIAAISVGERVMTRKGPCRVLAARMTQRQADLGFVRTLSGRILYATVDHPLYVAGKGFIKLCNLQKGDNALLYLRAGFIGSSLTDITFGCSEWGRGKKTNASDDISIGIFTRLLLGPFRLAMTCIIRTITAGITGSPIWRHSPWKSIALIMRDGGAKVRKLVINIAGLFVPNGCWLSPALVGVWFVGVDLLPEPLGMRPLGEPAAPNVNGETDSIVEISLNIRKADVYDIEVEGTHEFFANDLLVHNCQWLAADEIAAWQNDRATWEQAKFGHRLGDRTPCVIASTPKPKELIREFFMDKSILKIGGTMEENLQNLSPNFIKQMNILKGTRLGRQELAGELLDQEELGVIRRSQWKKFPPREPLPDFEIIVMSLDTALSEDNIDVKKQKTDYTACTVWGGWRENTSTLLRREDGTETMKRVPKIMLLDAWQERLGFPDLVSRVKAEKEKRYGRGVMDPQVVPLFGPRGMSGHGRKPDIILIEDITSGKSLRQQLRREGIPVIPYNPGKADKLLRLNICAAVFVAGYIWAFQHLEKSNEFAPSAELVIAQVCSYAGEDSLEHDDALDSATQALIWLQRNWLQMPVYQPYTPAKMHTPRGQNPYAT